ncbi:MAG: phosphoenolpyruvate hydrolase family protein [Planctomycetota bacterium]|nr:phosphoenolpyruvate hydrolase family protein [Planctomycetota bacterium]
MNRAAFKSRLTFAATNHRPFWGVGVSGSGELEKALAAKASWTVASMAGSLDPKLPASVMGILPYYQANSDVVRLSDLLRIDNTNIIAGVFAADQFIVISQFLDTLRRAGFLAVQNFPSVGIAGEQFRHSLEASGLGYQTEVDLIYQAGEKGLFTSAVVFTPEQTEAMLSAGADMLVFHPGITPDGTYASWNQETEARYAKVARLVPPERSDIVLARLAFAGDDTWRIDGPGIQYDRNML